MKQYLLVLVFTLICLPSLWAQELPCVYTDSNGNYYDFTNLAKATTSAKVSSGGYDFYLTPCTRTPKNSDVSCSNKNSPIIQIFENNCVAFLGDINTQTWSKDPTNNHIVLGYTNGQDCLPGYRSAKISFECDPTIESALYEAKSDYPEKCQYEFEWKTKYACPITPGSGGGLTGGAWFLIFLFAIILPVYLIGGVVYNMRFKGANGLEAIPNISFWRDLPSLIKEGCSFTFGRLCGKTGYQKV
jgi:hypothetical protein